MNSLYTVPTMAFLFRVGYAGETSIDAISFRWISRESAMGLK